MESIAKMSIELVITFVIFLVLLIVSGRILNEINLSKCSNDPNIKIAHKWTSWAVGISTTGVLVTIVLFILMFVL